MLSPAGKEHTSLVNLIQWAVLCLGATGPYHYVRHPMYAASIIYLVATTLLLESLNFKRLSYVRSDSISEVLRHSKRAIKDTEIVYCTFVVPHISR